MSTANTGAMSLIANRAISTKVAVGFACVLAILVIVSGAAYLSFHTSAEGFATYVQRVSVVGIARDVDRSFLNVRRFARDYAATGVESNVEAASKELASLRPLLQQGMAEIKNPERHRLLEGVVRNVEAYSKDFDQLVEQMHEQKKLVDGTLDPLGANLQQDFDTLIAAAAKAGNGSVEVLGYEGRQHLMLARLNVNKLLGRHEQAAGDAAEKSFANLTAALQSLDAATKGADYRKTFDDLQAGVASYRDSFHKAAELERGIDGKANGTMRDIGQQVQTDADTIKASGIAEEKQEEHDTLSTMASTGSLILYLSVGGLLAGAVLAWLIGRGISGPVVRMCVAMRALAGGDKTVEIPGVGRKDEIGQMADTVAVFKSNMIEADRLRAETEQHKAEVETARKAGMLQLADNFEAGIKGVVNSVASQATEMQSSAEAMTHTAEQATHQATAVAASVEEASANVQTVASSAEELSTSVLEIGRQVEQSSKIAGQAVIEADKTNATVEGLNKTAQRIGEVVQLIETIASQTNLQPLFVRKSPYIRRLSQNSVCLTHTIPMISWDWPETALDKRGCLSKFAFTLGEPARSSNRIVRREEASENSRAGQDHNMRRTGATMLGEMGELPDIIEAALNHVSIRSPLTATYNRSRYWPQVAAALQRLADALDGIEAGAAKVVPLRAGAGHSDTPRHNVGR